jgi:small-conductance mechanosensitive channel
VSSIPAPEVAHRAEEAGKLLREIDVLLVPGPAVVAIQNGLRDIGPRLAARIDDTNRRLEEEPTGVTLDGLTSQWRMLRAELVADVNVLAERATSLERALDRLTMLRETWTNARADARASGAPAQVVDRIDSVLSAASQARVRLQEERAVSLILQDRVAQPVAQCDDMLGRLATARDEAAGRLLVRDGVPLWRTEELSAAVTELPGRVRRAVESDILELRLFASDRRARLYVILPLFAVLVFLTYTMRRWASEPPSLDSTVPTLAALHHPLSAALLLTFLVGAGLSSPRSRVVQALGEIVVLLPALRIVRLGIEPRRRPTLHWLGGLLLVDLVRRLASPVPLLEQQIFLLEVIGVLGLLGWTLAPSSAEGPPGTGTRDRASRMAAGGALIAFVVAGIAAVTGYVRLAFFIGSGILGSVYVALVLCAGVVVAGALIAASLRNWPLRDLRMAQRHRPFLERRAHTVLQWCAIVGWAVLVLRHFGLWSPAAALSEAALAAELQHGSVSVSVGGVVAFLLTVIATFILSAIVRFVLQEEIYSRLAPERALPYAIPSLVHYLLLLAGVLLGLAALGVDLTKITILAGALGVGIGFGLQGLVNNFVSGLVILYERRINVGDAVQIGDVGGLVQQLGIRACTVRTWEGAEVIVPNGNIVSEKVANWTLSDRIRRVDVAVGVAYGTPPEKVADVLLGVARAHSYVLADPPPVVLFLAFGDSALRFELRVWTDRFESWLQTQSELAAAGYTALREAAIEIPLPQREVRWRPG